MATAKKYSVGDLVEVPEGAQVLRPDGGIVTVVGGLYVLDVEGSHSVRDGETFKAS